jgi:hypothetical protein
LPAPFSPTKPTTRLRPISKPTSPSTVFGP